MAVRRPLPDWIGCEGACESPRPALPTLRPATPPQAYRNTVPVPRHWSQKRAYLQGKRGIEKPPFQLPEFIEATGIGASARGWVLGSVSCPSAANGHDTGGLGVQRRARPSMGGMPRAAHRP